MSKKMLINASQHEESRVAIVEDGVLTELDIEIEGREQSKGNIYKATVVRVEPGLQAAFVDYGADRMGFLQIGELHPNLYPKSSAAGGRPRINDILKRGQEILVQIVREERDSKGAALTTFLSLAGRYMVLMPESDTKGVSRKIDNDSHRKKLKEAMAELDIPENMGYIVRTAGIGQKTAELHRDFHYLIGTYNKILDISKSGKAPQLIYRESNVVIRSIRDYFNTDMDEVLIDDPEVFREAQEFFRAVMPEYLHLLKLHQERRPIFSRYQIEEQIETLASNKVPLPSGGSIVIDRTEALVAIDVNSGKMAGEHGIEATAFKTNLEAAAEVGRQLRLRDLGGLIVIDFIDMRERSHNREVEKVVKNALKNDKARVSVGKISQFGLLEMSRQRIRAALAEGAYRGCPHCAGTGRVKSPEAQAVAFLRRVHTSCAKGAVERVIGRVPLVVANYLLNAKRTDLVELEKALGLSIEIVGDESYISGQSDLQITKREKQSEAKASGPVATAEFSEPITDAPPSQPDTAAQPDDESGPVAATAEKSENGKRKRRRKKKSAGAGDEAATPAADSAADVNDTEPASVTAAAEIAADGGSDQPADAAPLSAEAETVPATGEKKKRRRRRRRKSGARSEGEAGVEAGSESLSAEAAPMAADALDDALDDAPPSQAQPQSDQVMESIPAGESPAETVETTPADEAPKKPRRRRRKPKAEAPPSAPDAERAPESGPVTIAAPAAEPTTAIPPAAIEPAPAAPTSAVPAPSDAESAAAKPAKKPVRRRKAASTGDTPAPAGNDASPTAPAPEAETAKKPVRRKKTAPAKKPDANDVSSGEDTAEPAKKPARRSRAKKTPPDDTV